jgi:virulence-associated protein VapD
MARFAFVYDLTGAKTATYKAAREVLADKGWDVHEQGSFYLAPDGHGLVQCIEDLHDVVVEVPDFGTAVNSAHLVEFTQQNDVSGLLNAMADAVKP